MFLKDLLIGIAGLDVLEKFGKEDISSVSDDSRKVTTKGLFAAVSGPALKGEDFIPDAVAKGAKAVIYSDQNPTDFNRQYSGVCFVKVRDPRVAFRQVVERFYGQPSSQVRTIGVTGTNGKTTITYLFEAILSAMGKSSGVVGTVNCRIGGKIVPSKNTTPGLLDNQIFLRKLADARIDYAVMEVSSHALDQGRVDLVDFRGGIFTNLTGDHLDYHKTMDAYFEAKSRLFTSLSKEAYAVINADDPYGRRLCSMTPARVITYGIDSDCDVRAKIDDYGLNGTRFAIEFFGKKIVLNTTFIGLHNVYNILAAFAAGLGEGFPPEKIKQGIERLHCVPGRLERVDGGQDFFIFIDYAHTDDGLKNVLTSLRAVGHKQLIVVFGCGGDRDRTKRPRMGRVACDLADLSIVTSDNPRREDPWDIVQEIIPGFTKETYEVFVDRKEAIERALTIAQKGDIVLLAGKGHETYQVLKEGEIKFVERDIVTGFLQAKTGCGRKHV